MTCDHLLTSCAHQRVDSPLIFIDDLLSTNAPSTHRRFTSHLQRTLTNNDEGISDQQEVLDEKHRSKKKTHASSSCPTPLHHDSNLTPPHLQSRPGPSTGFVHQVSLQTNAVDAGPSRSVQQVINITLLLSDIRRKRERINATSAYLVSSFFAILHIWPVPLFDTDTVSHSHFCPAAQVSQFQSSSPLLYTLIQQDLESQDEEDQGQRRTVDGGFTSVISSQGVVQILEGAESRQKKKRRFLKENDVMSDTTYCSRNTVITPPATWAHHDDLFYFDDMAVDRPSRHQHIVFPDHLHGCPVRHVLLVVPVKAHLHVHSVRHVVAVPIHHPIAARVVHVNARRVARCIPATVPANLPVNKPIAAQVHLHARRARRLLTVIIVVNQSIETQSRVGLHARSGRCMATARHAVDAPTHGHVHQSAPRSSSAASRTRSSDERGPSRSGKHKLPQALFVTGRRQA
ncbi:hypothetical protein F5887DRAFT_925655 [Amanita rubescens]|nr:hypothetical protein F5887DRAFT_925655 [Amanita rubescens]